MSGATPSARVAGGVAARLDRLPAGPIHWRLVLLTQMFWGLVVGLDPIIARIYPVVWKPEHAITPSQYELLVGFSNGLGPLLGLYLGGFFSDRFGRRKTMVAACLVAGLLYVPLAFTTSFALMMIIVTFASFGVGAAVASAPAYATEISPPAARGRLMLGGQTLAFAILNFVTLIPALLLLPAHPVAFILVSALAPVVIMVPLILAFVPESPRWLEGKGRREEAERVLAGMEAAALRKHGSLPEPDPAPHEVPVTERVPVSEVFRGAYLRRTVLLLAVWLLAYAGLDYGMTPYLAVFITDHGFGAGPLFTMQMISGAGSVVILFAGAWLGERMERKTLMFASGVCVAVGALILYGLPTLAVALTIGLFFAKAGEAGFLSSMYNYTATAFPTRVRAVGVGWTDGIGHIGAVLGPLIAGAFYSATASAGNAGWFLWFAIPGAIIPGLLMLVFGIRQRDTALERLSA